MIVNIIPNEKWELIIEFDRGEYRLFSVSLPREQYGWSALAYPREMKSFRFNEKEIQWKFGGRLNEDYLYDNSVSLDTSTLEIQNLRLGYRNQAPTDKDEVHHVFGVYLYPFSSKLFAIGESIGGGYFYCRFFP